VTDDPKLVREMALAGCTGVFIEVGDDEVARVGGHLGILRAGRDAGAPASGEAQPSRPGTDPR